MDTSTQLDIEKQIQSHIVSLHQDISKIYTQMIIIRLLKKITKDWGIDSNAINPNTKLKRDLDLESLDVVHLIVSLEDYFQQKFDFAQLLMQSGQYVEDLSVEELITFVDQKIVQLPNDSNLLVGV